MGTKYKNNFVENQNKSLRYKSPEYYNDLRPVSRKPRKVFGPVKTFLDPLYLKTEKCIRLKLLYEGSLPSSLEFVNKTAL